MAFWAKTEKTPEKEPVEVLGEDIPLATPLEYETPRPQPRVKKDDSRLEALEKRIEALEKTSKLLLPTFDEFVDYCKQNRGKTLAGYFAARFDSPKKPDNSTVMKILAVLDEMRR